jgi:nitrite reductase (NO-forming)
MQRPGFVMIGLLVATLVLSACSSSGATSATPVPEASPSSDAQQVMLKVGNAMSFDPASITVRAGQPVQLTLQNSGLMPHDFSLSDGVAQPVKITASGGQSATGVFTVDTPGTYSFVCSMPGHAEGGMRGTITVE